MEDDIQANAVEFLERDHLLNITMLESIRKNNATIIGAVRDGVLLLDQPSNTMMISASSAAAAADLMQSLSQPYDFLVMQKEYAELIARRFNLKSTAEYYQAVYLKNEPIRLESALELINLGRSDLALVRAFYETDDFSYIENRLEEHDLWAGFDRDNCIGFVGVHDEGSIGLLQVRPQYRHRGYGKQLLALMTNRYIRLKSTPYSQISYLNQASINLHKAVGYTLSKQSVIWLTK